MLLIPIHAMGRGLKRRMRHSGSPVSMRPRSYSARQRRNGNHQHVEADVGTVVAKAHRPARALEKTGGSGGAAVAGKRWESRRLRKLASAISGQYQSIAAATYLPEGYLRLRLRFTKPRYQLIATATYLAKPRFEDLAGNWKRSERGIRFASARQAHASWDRGQR